ncbi:MAG: alpha/beta hydrolase domain-containing protein, partial [Thermoguttaceae bacterium]
MNRGRICGLALSLLTLLTCLPGRAEVVRVKIDQRVPFADGHAFGRTGPYEKITGRLFLEVDPNDPANARIADLKLAPRNARGRVEFWSDFFLLKPQDPKRGNGHLLYEVNNRGNKLALWTFNGTRGNNPTSLADAGNGFLMEQGYSVLWCGWNGDVVEGDGRLLIGLPVARDGDRPITGKIHVEICRDERVFSQPFYWGPWGISTAYPPVNPDHRAATLTMRPDRTRPAVEIPHDQWAFGRWEEGKLVPDPVHLYVKEGLRPGWLYELVYEGRDPRVNGLGLAAVRDCVSFFRYAAADRAGTANPLASDVARTSIFGISQSGRFINHFLFEGFNTDEQRRMVFDGAMSHVAGAGRGLFSQRFGIATLTGTPHENMLCGTDAFPFATMPQTDPLTGQTGELFARCKTAGHLPKIVITQTSTEYWTRAASLVHTDVEGTRDVPLDPNVRLYTVAGAQHLGGTPAERGICQNLHNPLDDRGPVLRALLVALDRWLAGGQEPPASRYPRIADGTLVTPDAYRNRFPKIPGVNLPAGPYRPPRLDFGSRWTTEGIADQVPPRVGPAYCTLVPAVDADGNEVGGIRLPDIAVPTATYTGWNLRAAACGAEGRLVGFHGSYLPLTRTPAERQQAADPRPSVLQRYPTRETYVARIRQSALDLQRQGFLLGADVEAIVSQAAARDLWPS